MCREGRSIPLHATGGSRRRRGREEGAPLRKGEGGASWAGGGMAVGGRADRASGPALSPEVQEREQLRPTHRDRQELRGRDRGRVVRRTATERGLG